LKHLESKYCEEASFKFDPKELAQAYHEAVAGREPFKINEKFGGWSLQSATGSYLDGFGKYLTFDENHRTLNDVRTVMKDSGVKSPLAYNKPTEICTGYFAEIIRSLEIKNLVPRRARLMLLDPGGGCKFHRDAPEWLYLVRLHIPIVTNPGCFFEVEGVGKQHLDADGRAYFIDTTYSHRVSNEGSSRRVHLVVDIYDLDGLTLRHKYPEDKKEELKGLMSRY